MECQEWKPLLQRVHEYQVSLIPGWCGDSIHSTSISATAGAWIT